MAARRTPFDCARVSIFTPDPAFKDQKRELTAQNFVYSYMRFVDPANRSPYAFLVAGKFIGLDELAAQAEKTHHFDYDAKILGVSAVDRYTLRFRLREPDYNFPFIAAHTTLGAVAREVIEAYGDDSVAHPVGRGPYVLKDWTRRAKIVLEANPDYHMVFDVSKFDENRKAAKACQLQMWGSSWIADYPDGDNFMQNFYGSNTG